MRAVRATVAMTLVAIVAAGCGGDTGGPPRVAAVVEGTKIQAAETESLVASYLKQDGNEERKKGGGREQAIPFVLLYQIRHTLLRHLAADMNIAVDTAPASEAVAQLAQSEPQAFDAAGVRPGDVTASAEAGRLSRAIALRLFPDVPVTEEEVRSEYDNRAPLYNQGWRLQAKVAAFSSAESAARVAPAMAAGRPFDEAATAAGASDVGAVEISPASPLPPAVLQVAGKLARGKVSDPLRVSTSGWALIFVEQREELPQISFGQARGELTQVAADARRQQLFEAWFDKHLKEARVTVDRYYGKWDDEQDTVVR